MCSWIQTSKSRVRRSDLEVPGMRSPTGGRGGQDALGGAERPCLAELRVERAAGRREGGTRIVGSEGGTGRLVG